MPDIPPNPEIPEDLSQVLDGLMPGGYEVVDAKVEGGVLQSFYARVPGIEYFMYLYEREGMYYEGHGSVPTIMLLRNGGEEVEVVGEYLDGAWVISRTLYY